MFPSHTSKPLSARMYARLSVGESITQFVESARIPCCKNTTSFATELFFSPRPRGIRCMARMKPSDVVTWCSSQSYPLLAIIWVWWKRQTLYESRKLTRRRKSACASDEGKKCLRKGSRNSILITCDYPDLPVDRERKASCFSLQNRSTRN